MKPVPLVALVLAALASAPARAQDDGPKTFRGPAVRATGTASPSPEQAGTPQGRLMARRAAEAVALRNLVAEVRGYFEVREGEDVTRIVEGFVSGYEVTRVTEKEDGSVEVEVALPLEKVAASFREGREKNARLEEEVARLRAELDAMKAEAARLSALLDRAAAEIEELGRRLRGGR
ncbi:MAG: hypothetical protein HY720_04615 [Planctomycetes bacterium]|nr:hypothetical protein [Planctomycetota bacterium]